MMYVAIFLLFLSGFLVYLITKKRKYPLILKDKKGKKW